MKRAAGIFILVAAAIILARIAYLQVGRIPFFELTNVRVDCPDGMNKSDLITKSHLRIGECIFRQDLKRASHRLMELPGVQGVSISRQLPSTVDIVLQPDDTLLLVKADRFYGLTRSKRLVGINQVNNILPLVTGIGGSRLDAPGGLSRMYYIDQVRLCYALMIIDKIKSLSVSLENIISEIHFTDNWAVEIYLDPNGLKVLLPLRNLDEALSRLAEMETRGILKESGSVDMSYGRMICRAGI